MNLLWYEDAWKDYCTWQQGDKKTLKRINGLIKEIQRDVYDGIGKPEPLKGNLAGWWSRRIDDENRRQNHRLEKLEKIADQLTDMVVSIKAMAVTMQGMQEEQKRQGQRLEKIEEKPADNWNTLVKTILTVVVTAAVTWLLSKGGI